MENLHNVLYIQDQLDKSSLLSSTRTNGAMEYKQRKYWVIQKSTISSPNLRQDKETNNITDLLDSSFFTVLFIFYIYLWSLADMYCLYSPTQDNGSIVLKIEHSQGVPSAVGFPHCSIPQISHEKNNYAKNTKQQSVQ